MRALVLADGDRVSRNELDAAWPGWDDGISLVVAADGGARLARDLGCRIDLWVGDGDSLGAEELAGLERQGVPVQRARADKDESDAELALVAAIRLGATDITVLGALGGRRLDHALANVALLSHPELRRRPARLLDARTRVMLLDAPADGPRVLQPLPGRPGDLVSLLPWGAPVEGVTTTGLRYRLRDATLQAGPARGLSNVRDVDDAAVEIRRGRLLVVESALRSGNGDAERR
jgi:thiamine pyrophosphokinase